MPQTQSQPAMSPVLRGRSQSRPMTVLERKANATDRRKSRRIKTRAWVWADYHGKQYHLRNLSLAGAFVRMEDPPRKGAKVEIRLEGERLVEPIEVTALVRRCWREHGMGVEFTRFRGVGRARLDELLASLAVARILGDGTRTKTRAFTELQSHYLFAEKFGRPGKGNDKGKVEGLVGYARRNFLVPVPRYATWEALNAQLRAQCQTRRARILRGHQQTIGERFEKDHERLLPLPAAPYEACEKRATRVTSMALVRYRANDYSVPVQWGHREVLVKGFVHEVVICAASEVIARHRRSYEREDVIFDPLHYLALLEQKPNALDQAAPLAGWDLPEGFASLRRLMEARLGKRGKREYVQTLRLLETFALLDVSRAIDDALRLGAISFDAVKHLLLCRIEHRPARLDLAHYPHLPTAQVGTTVAADYLALLSEGPG